MTRVTCVQLSPVPSGGGGRPAAPGGGNTGVRYLGGKARTAPAIAAVILAATPARALYVEPFLGAGSVAARLAPHFRRAYLSDASPDLIELWRALLSGWHPPEQLGEDEWRALRGAPVSALRGFAGYGCSFGGRWFEGYARNGASCRGNPGKTIAENSARALEVKARALAGAALGCHDYRAVHPPAGAVVYLDPPYAGGKQYGNVPPFTPAEFWRYAEALSATASVFVSEYHAPPGWVPVLSAALQTSMRQRGKSGRVTDRLWTYAGGGRGAG